MNKYIKFIIGLLISVVGIWYAFRQFNFSEFIAALSNVNYFYLLGAIIIQFIAVWFRAVRWKWLISPIKEIPTKPLFDATMIGYFGNNILPLRMGELLRAYVVSDKYKISTSKVIGTLVVDRILDLVALTIFALFFLFNSDLMNIPQWIMIFSIIVTISLFTFLIYIGGKNPDWFSIKKRFSVFKSKIGSKLFDIFANMISGLSVLKKTKQKFGVYSFIIVLWILYFISFLFMVKGVNLELNLMNIGVLYVLLTLAISIPAAPGYVGTYHAICVAVLTNVYNIDLVASQTFAIVSHAAVFIPFVVVGAIIFVKNSLNFSKLKSLEISES